MSATLAWIYEGGAKNCQGCAEVGAACASGGRVRDQREDAPGDPPRYLCPFREHEPRTAEGALVLTLLQSGRCIRSGGWGFEGIDTAEALRRLAFMKPAMPDWLALDLLDAAEAGIVRGIAAAREAKDEE